MAEGVETALFQKMTILKDGRFSLEKMSQKKPEIEQLRSGRNSKQIFDIYTIL